MYYVFEYIYSWKELKEVLTMEKIKPFIWPTITLIVGFFVGLFIHARWGISDKGDGFVNLFDLDRSLAKIVLSERYQVFLREGEWKEFKMDMSHGVDFNHDKSFSGSVRIYIDDGVLKSKIKRALTMEAETQKSTGLIGGNNGE